MPQAFSTDDVATHNTPDSLWVIIDQTVYDVTKFQKDHPGGKKILQKFAGKDASKQFRNFHNEADRILLKYKDELQLGGLEVGAMAELTPVVEPVPEAAQPVVGIA
ncbi:hypothetical protein UCDDA912_g10152 [Diaporthe ampelina]|uniref:Cytochrome b5 heme-binding domain-containing protein n=1 Tax=Diaporthe ampelina TaxID=1214573 RepID=A0A0G2HNY3_9PEZI|nr:hypothetical protein UCDDA912_g10152 [Diaporthe ampelina]